MCGRNMPRLACPLNPQPGSFRAFRRKEDWRRPEVCSSIVRSMDPSFTYTVADLAPDQALRLPCACRVRTIPRERLVALVGRDVRLHLIGLRQELWCAECGEP